VRAEDTASVAKPIIYHDRHFNMDAAKIGPGEYYITQRDMMIVTVLAPACRRACATRWPRSAA
jgi:chemotaxis protein CheD